MKMQNKCDWINWWDICRNVRYKIEIEIEIKIIIKNDFFLPAVLNCIEERKGHVIWHM